jgi:hypothetical protein
MTNLSRSVAMEEFAELGKITPHSNVEHRTGKSEMN